MPIGIDDDGVAVAPIVGVVDVPSAERVVPVAERVVPVAKVDVVPSISDPVVDADPVLLREVSAGSLVADGPTPNLAAKELKSVAVPKPKVASSASKSGSDKAAEIGVVAIGGNVTVLVVGTVDVVVPKLPPSVEPEFGVENCACATQGVVNSATGASHAASLFISPPCPTLDIRIDRGGARVVPRRGTTIGLCEAEGTGLRLLPASDVHPPNICHGLTTTTPLQMKSSCRHDRSDPAPAPLDDDPLPEPVTGAEPALGEVVGLSRGLPDVEANWPSEPTVELTIVGVPIVPLPISDVDGPTGGIGCTPIVGTVGVPMLGSAGVPIVGVFDVPMAGSVGVPIVGLSGVPMLGCVGVPMVGVSGVPMLGCVGAPMVGIVGVPIVDGVGVPIVGRVGVPIVGRAGMPIVGLPIVGSVDAPVPNVEDSAPMPGVTVVCIEGNADIIGPKPGRPAESNTVDCA